MNKETILEFIAAKSIYDNACTAASKTYQTANDTIWFLRRQTHAKVSKYRYYEQLWKTSLDAMCKKDLLTSLYHHDRVIDCGYCWDYETDWHDEEIAANLDKIQKILTTINFVFACPDDETGRRFQFDTENIK